jgi:hypothetical protein
MIQNISVTSDIMKEFFGNIENYFMDSDDYLHNARNQIKIITYNNSKYVVKSFRTPNLFNKIIYTFFKDSKAKRSYDNSIRIGNFTPKPIGYVEFQKDKILDKSYFVSEYFEYDFTIREPLLDKDYPNRAKIFELFAIFTYRLHQDNIYHLDYSPGNILIKQDGNNYIFKIVDVNRMKFCFLDTDTRLKNFNKLWADDEDMKIIISTYSQYLQQDKQYCIDKAIYYSQKNKNFKNFKKKLKKNFSNFSSHRL